MTIPSWRPKVKHRQECRKTKGEICKKMPRKVKSQGTGLNLLKWLVDHVHKKKEEDLMEYLDDHFCADDVRGICAGYDAFNNVYWYLDDLRLYRENSFKKPNKKDWECVCLTYSDWQTFLKQFRKTSNP
uniref:Uncharacterized protein n=1 Tax=Strigamia maritima TaxID=126957 RepID=T1J1I9_STRMM